MTVHELIETLKGFDPSLRVVVQMGRTGQMNGWEATTLTEVEAQQRHGAEDWSEVWDVTGPWDEEDGWSGAERVVNITTS